jgi:histidinol-phosphate aminotransferase
VSNRPEVNPSILEIAAYVPGKSKAAPGIEPIKLSANESPLGASPKAQEAYKNHTQNLAIYPDGAATKLRDAIGDVHGLDPARIGVGSGSDELLHLIAQLYIQPGDEAVMSQFGFLVYPIVTRGAGGTPVFAPETDLKTDVDAMLGAVTQKTKVVYLANPNNPTGSYLNADELNRLHAGLPKNVVLVIDAAYAEYVDAADYKLGFDLVDKHENVVVTRTFSKIGLANLRVGWLYGSEHFMDGFNRLRGPFNVNGAAMEAAQAAVRDVAFTAQLKSHNKRLRDRLVAELQSNWFRTRPSQGNFVLTEFSQEPGHTAQDAFEALLAEGLVVREMGSYGLPHALRISIGHDKDMTKLMQVLHGMNTN